MSGGHFDYGCYRISQFADDLQHEIDLNDDTSDDGYGGTRGRGYGSDVMERLTVAQQWIRIAGRLAREIEWLYSGDHGEESFCKLMDRILDEEGVSLRIMIHKVLARCIDDGITLGIRRAYKHTSVPTEDIIHNEVERAIENEINEYFTFDAGDDA